MNHANRCAHKGETIVRLLREKRDVVKILTKKMAIEAFAQFEEVGCLEQSLTMARNTLEILNERVLLLKDQVVAISIHNFKRERGHVPSFILIWT